MILNALDLHNYRGFETLHIDFEKNITVLVGGNGSGNTSVLEAAAIAVGTFLNPLDGVSSKSIAKSDAYLEAFRIGRVDDVQSQYPVEITAFGEIDGKKIQWKRSLNGPKGNTTIADAKAMTKLAQKYQTRLRKGDPDLLLPLIAYYGTGRLWDYHREKKGDLSRVNTRTNGYIDCLDGTANIKLMMNWFKKMTIQNYQDKELGREEIPELKVVYAAMEKCLALAEEHEKIQIRYNLNTEGLDVYYEDSPGERMRMPLNQMSDGNKSTISLIADIAYRMAQLNPQLLDEVLNGTPGIVMIDEIDLHLHPAWQRHILRDLTMIFPMVQFIVTTHAPSVINTTREKNLRILREGRLVNVPNQTYGKDVNTITREVMDVAQRPVSIMSRFNQFYQMMDKQDYGKAEGILDDLESEIGTDDTELVSCRVRLELEQL